MDDDQAALVPMLFAPVGNKLIHNAVISLAAYGAVFTTAAAGCLDATQFVVLAENAGVTEMTARRCRFSLQIDAKTPINRHRFT